ncbi:uncharacterized protein CIMG_13439 [Coccidioides immitis RS]|uniref:Uncharacterized protein n=1 Tax=Coccidioides immitis (strain RS) TaxID=246410 RepID=A0A0D8JUY1_COCIM|nr:uncharacterized protein CIMG_13439 [Coccidioides immitis RS]KJF61120.1 hypothetical protein CIMG_13439 [Coccidioides immitis RS]
MAGHKLHKQRERRETTIDRKMSLNNVHRRKKRTRRTRRTKNTRKRMRVVVSGRHQMKDEIFPPRRDVAATHGTLPGTEWERDAFVCFATLPSAASLGILFSSKHVIMTEWATCESLGSARRTGSGVGLTPYRKNELFGQLSENVYPTQPVEPQVASLKL